MNNIFKNEVKSNLSKFVGIFLFVFLFVNYAELLSQANYSFTLNQRRMGDTIGVEVWVKSLNNTTANLGNMTIPIIYDAKYLTPANLDISNPNSWTDSISYDMELIQPYQKIESPFANASNGYSSMTAQPITGTNGTKTLNAFILDVNTVAGSPTGFKPAQTGKGSFVGLLKFYIHDNSNLTETALTGIDFNNATWLATIAITDINGNDVTTESEFIKPNDFTIRGITILSPNFLNQAINRYPDIAYPSLAPNKGYPIYFERSGLVGNLSEYATNKVAYTFEYSLDNGTSWGRVGQAAEHSFDITADTNLYANGDIDSRYAAPLRFITQFNDSLLVASGPGIYSNILKTIWKANENFPYRSEQARLRIVQADTMGYTSDLSLRNSYSTTNTNRYDVNDNSYVLGRLFFVQLDGTSKYMKTERPFSNSTVLTVEAWVNLNSIQSAEGAEPGVVISSAGSISPQEGAWMLYLKDGKYPAFRAREIEGRGPGGYIGSLVSPYELTVTSDARPISQSHSQNWAHLAAVVNNNVVKLYVNGEEVDRYTNKEAVNIRMMTSNHPIWVGVNPNGGIDASDYLHAGIKEVKVWRSALSQDVIRKHAGGVYNPIDISDLSNERVKLELYYTLQGIRKDVASEAYYQNDITWLNSFDDANISAQPTNELIVYRPDKPHIRLTSPVGNEGVVNLKDVVYNVRWIAYGLGSTAPNSKDLMIQISRDNGNTWFDAIDNQIPGLPLDQVDIETSQAKWEPYNNATSFGQSDDLQGIIDIANNYSKNVKLKISGTEERQQEDIADTSGTFIVAPYFALSNNTNNYIKVAGNVNQNMINSSPLLLEAWIRPYRFPTEAEGNFPIITKKADDNSGNLHYALRLMPTGQLQFEVVSLSGQTNRIALSSPNFDSLVTIPNVIENDTAWTHIAVFASANNSGESSVIFYIDGTPQNQTSLMNQLGSNINVDKNNKYPLYIGAEPGNSPEEYTSFIGDIKEVRIWNGYPSNLQNTNDLTYFIQGALSVRANELGVFNGIDYSQNLVSAYSMNGGSWINGGIDRSLVAFPINDDLNAKIYGTDYSYKATKPYLKVIEPTFRQKVRETEEDLNVRWVGFDYNRNDLTSFLNGSDLLNHASVEFSVEGGGGQIIQPYQFVASQTYNPGYLNSLTLPISNKYYEFPGTLNKSQFAGTLNVSMSDPDLNNDSSFVDQGKLAPANSNARLRLNARSTINGYTLFHINGVNGTYGYVNNLRPESKLFSITPLSNFTVRVLLEGYHEGKIDGIKSNLGSRKYPDGNALNIELFENLSDKPGNLISAAISDGYVNNTTAFATANRNAGANNFANVPFVFDTINNGRYFVKLTHINHLPIMSRFAAPFLFTGDSSNTWYIESGWDFQNWDGDTTSTGVMTSVDASSNPVAYGTKYSAFGNISINESDSKYALAGLVYNDGRDDSTNATFNNPLAAMVGGDVNMDGRINALDRVKVVADNGTETIASQVKGGIEKVNATDRQIVYRNNGKEVDPQLPIVATQPIAIPGEISNIASYDNDSDLNMYLQAEKSYSSIKNKKLSDEPRLLASGVAYRVVAKQRIVDKDYVDVDFHITNLGGNFGLGNSTFGITFETNKLEFVEMQKTEKVIFDNNLNLGYFPTFSSPIIGKQNAATNLRTIDINFDNYPLANKPGIDLPHQPTYLGTLRFRRNDNSAFYKFEWNSINAVYTVKGANITDNGQFVIDGNVKDTINTKLTFPVGGEILIAGRPYSITWIAGEDYQSININFSSDGGTTWNKLNTTPINIVSNSFNWNTPKINSDKCLIQLLDATTGKLIDRSATYFTLTSSPIVITRPSINDAVYTGGVTDYIRWEMNENLPIKFEFSEDGSTNWFAVSNIIQSNLLSVQWVLPSVNSSKCVVRMVHGTTGEVLASSSPFRILTGALTLFEPKLKDTVKAFSTKGIKWNYNNVNTFDLQLSLNGGKDWTTISTNVKALPKRYDWYVPNHSTNNAVIRALYIGSSDLEYSRTDTFTIINDVTQNINDNEKYGYIINSVVPNPFSQEALVTFSLPKEELTTIGIYDLNGQLVVNIANNQMFSKGENRIVIKSDKLSSGMYILKINAGMFNLVKEIIHIK